MFRYFGCRFQNDECKQRAARVVMWKELGINNSFTFEASFHGYFDKEKNTHEFTPEMYEEMGANLVNSLYEYMMIMEEDDRRKLVKKEVKNKYKKKTEQAG